MYEKKLDIGTCYLLAADLHEWLLHQRCNRIYNEAYNE